MLGEEMQTRVRMKMVLYIDGEPWMCASRNVGEKVEAGDFKREKGGKMSRLPAADKERVDAADHHKSIYWKPLQNMSQS